MSLSKELSEAKILAKKISDAQKDIREKTLSLKIGQDEKTGNISDFLKPVVEPLTKLVQLKDKKVDFLRKMKEKQSAQSVSIKREPTTASLRRLPSLLKKFESPSGRSAAGTPETEYASPLESWNFDSTVQTPETNYPSSPIEYDRNLLQKQYNQTVFPSPGYSSSSPFREKRFSISMPNSPQPSADALQRGKLLERRRELSSSLLPPFEATSSEWKEEIEPKKTSLIDRFLQRIQSNDSIEIDKATGIKSKQGKYYLGKKEIHFSKIPSEHFTIDGKVYPVTHGLMELLFLKQPNQENISTLDERNYKNIIENTQLDPITTKVMQYGKGMMVESNQDKEYVYFDNPNELIQRLLLLKRSQAAGNLLAHNNEILSIEEELREANIIN